MRRPSNARWYSLVDMLESLVDIKSVAESVLITSLSGEQNHRETSRLEALDLFNCKEFWFLILVRNCVDDTVTWENNVRRQDRMGQHPFIGTCYIL